MQTGQISQDHPLDEMFRKKFKDAKMMKMMTQGGKGGPGGSMNQQYKAAAHPLINHL